MRCLITEKASSLKYPNLFLLMYKLSYLLVYADKILLGQARIVSLFTRYSSISSWNSLIYLQHIGQKIRNPLEA